MLGLSHVFSFDRDVSAICHRLVYLPDLLARVSAREKPLTSTNAVKLPSAERPEAGAFKTFNVSETVSKGAIWQVLQ